MQTLLAILLGKTIIFISRLFKFGGGSAAPGLYALKIQPDLVSRLSAKIPRNIVITGTNGKTTTARMLAHFAKESGLKVIRNHTGSNLERGIASALISNYTLYPKPYTLDLGIWELDEAAFNPVVRKIKPDMIVFLNVFRDQLDRYGEVDTVVKKWTSSLKQINKHTVILVNGDDMNLLKLQDGFSGHIESFGVKGSKIKGELTSSKYTPGKIGYLAKEIQQEGLKGTYFEVLNQDFFLPLPGVYHVYDAVAAIIAAHKLRLPLNALNKAFKSYSPAFGRLEKLPFGFIFLIKNPAGATAVFETIAPKIKSNDKLLIALNDNLADGKDVSWIWDADFETLLTPSLRAQRSNPKKRLPRHFVPRNDAHVIVSGSRAPDLAVRLKYAGFDPKQIRLEPDIKKALKKARAGLKHRLFILPTYTAMLELQDILTKMGIKRHYWEEE